MKDKILVMVYVPMLEQEYDIYIPLSKKIGTVKNLIVSIIEEQSNGTFVNDNCKNLYDKKTGDILNEQLFVKKSSIHNGSRLILY